MIENKFIVAVLSWAAGILGTVVVQQVLNRRRILSYFVHHQCNALGQTWTWDIEDRTQEEETVMKKIIGVEVFGSLAFAIV